MDAASAWQGQPPVVQRVWRVSAFQLGLGLTLLALAARLVGLGMRPLWLDEAYSAWFASRGWHELWTVVPTYEPHPPFYYSLLKLWRSLFGESAVALRSFSVGLGVLTVPVVLAAAKELERQRPSGRPQLSAAIAGFLAACSPMLLLLDQEARPYPLLIFAYAVASLGLLRLMREFRDDGAGKLASWTMLALGTEITLWAHGLGLLYALCLAVALAPAWLKPPIDRGRIVRGLGCALLVALLYVPCLVMMLKRVGDWGSGWLRWAPVKLLQLFGLYSVPYETLTIGTAVAALAMLLLIKRGVQAAFEDRGWNAGKAIMLLWWGPPILAVLSSMLFVPLFLPRTLTATLVPAYLAIGGAVARTPAPRERFGLAAALCIPLLISTVQVARRPAAEPWDEVAAYLDAHVARGELVWLYPNDSALPLRAADRSGNYRARGIPGDYPAVGLTGPIRAGSPAVVSLTSQQARRVVDDPALRAVPTIWLVTRQSTLFDPSGDLPRALARVRRPGQPRDWGYITVQPYYKHTER